MDQFTYDALGRRLINGSTAYFYIEDEEIGSFRNGQIEELKVLEATAPVAIEIKDKPFAPVVDVQNTTRHLVDWNTKEVAFENPCDAFGKGLSGDIPYAYVNKRYDFSSGLVYFGKRFYDPNLGRWLTPDPLGAVDHSNLYQYVFNNPFYYFDPDGQEAFTMAFTLWGTSQAGGLSFAALTGPVGWVIGGAAILTTVIAWKGPEIAQKVNNWLDYKAESQSASNESWKNTNVYAPDRPLPLTEDGIPLSEADVPHTELGTRDGSKGKYPQAREFDKDGKPVRDIDFTDHGYPNNHPNPHQHKPKPNPTGGTPQRGKPEPVPEWSY